MGAVYESGFEAAINNGGLINVGNGQIGLSLDNSAFAAYDFTEQGSPSNPSTWNDADWNRSGERLQGNGSVWDTWESDGSQTVGSLDIEINDPTGTTSYLNFARIDGNDLPQTVSNGVDVTLEVSSTNGTVNLVRPGIAEVLLRGEANTTPYYVLLDSGTVLTSKNASSTQSWTWDNGNNEFTQSSNVQFSNGGGWPSTNVTAIEVREGSSTGPTIMRDDSVSATVQSGGSITFTDITLSISGLT